MPYEYVRASRLLAERRLDQPHGAVQRFRISSHASEEVCPHQLVEAWRG
jgi:hypothetical protein